MAARQVSNRAIRLAKSVHDTCERARKAKAAYLKMKNQTNAYNQETMDIMAGERGDKKMVKVSDHFATSDTSDIKPNKLTGDRLENCSPEAYKLALELIYDGVVPDGCRLGEFGKLIYVENEE